MALSGTDTLDVKNSFDVLDQEKVDRISLPNFHTLFLGLGFQPKELTLEELRTKVADAINLRRTKSKKIFEDTELLEANINDDTESLIPLSLVLEILTKHSRDRNHEMEHCFRLFDPSKKGQITAQDLLRVSREVGEPLSWEEAEAMITTTESERVGPAEFKKLFTADDP